MLNGVGSHSARIDVCDRHADLQAFYNLVPHPSLGIRNTARRAHLSSGGSTNASHRICWEAMVVILTGAPCTHEHTEQEYCCRDCDYGGIFIETLRNMLEKLQREDLLRVEEHGDLAWKITDFHQKHDKYLTHIIRGYHEINEKNKVFRELPPVGEVGEVIDWKMKFMMHLFR